MRLATALRRLALIHLGLLCLGAQAVPLTEQARERPPALDLPGQAQLPVVPDAERARAALAKGLWAEALRQSVKVMAQRVPDVDSLGIVALCAAVLGETTLREAALNRLLQVEAEPRYYHTLVSGVVDLTANRVDSAARRFEEILMRSPDDPLLRYFRGRVQEAAGRPQEALADYQATLRKMPDFAPALAAAASLYSTRGAHGKAVKLMERAVSIDPANPAYARALAEVYDRAGQKDKARALYQELLKAVPGTMDAMLNGAWNLLRAGRAQDVREQVARVTRLYGPQPLGHLLLAMAAADLGQYREIPAHLTEYLRAKGRTQESVAAASLVYLALGDGQGAIRLFDSPPISPVGNAQASVNLAVAHQLAGQLDKAADMLKQAAAAGESPGLLAFFSANLALARGNLEDYRASMALAESFLPGSAALPLEAEGRLAAAPRQQLAAWRNAAVVMLLNGWNSPMARHAERALHLLPSDPLALYLKGLSLRAAGQGPQALDSLQRALGRAPDFLSAGLAQAHVLLDLGRVADARALIGRMEAQARTGRTLYQLGLLHERAGNGAQARKLMQMALKTSETGNWRQAAEAYLGGNRSGR